LSWTDEEAVIFCKAALKRNKRRFIIEDFLQQRQDCYCPELHQH